MELKYIDAIKELEKMLADAKKNRAVDDPDGENNKWAGYIQGIEGAIYRLEMQA
jgi:hypothetical protein